MSDARARDAEQELAAAFGSHAVAVAADLRDQIARNQATAEALHAYLRDRGPEAAASGAVVVLAPSPACVRDARAYARRRGAEQHLQEERSHVLELAVSELLGNAIRYGWPPVSYEIAPDGEDLVLVVRDGNPDPPGDGGDCGTDGEGGRGLFLIAQLARSWGWDLTGAGKQVWVRV